MADLVTSFFNPPYGSKRFGQFPVDQFMISMEFEVAGAYEDWGWVMYEKDPKTMTYKTFCTGRTLVDLIGKAEEKLRLSESKKEDTVSQPLEVVLNRLMDKLESAHFSSDPIAVPVARANLISTIKQDYVARDKVEAAIEDVYSLIQTKRLVRTSKRCVTTSVTN